MLLAILQVCRKAKSRRRPGLSLPTIKRVESDRDVSVSPAALAAVKTALEDAGVIFVAENGEGPGVRLRKT